MWTPVVPWRFLQHRHEVYIWVFEWNDKCWLGCHKCVTFKPCRIHLNDVGSPRPDAGSRGGIGRNGLEWTRLDINDVPEAGELHGASRRQYKCYLFSKNMEIGAGINAPIMLQWILQKHENHKFVEIGDLPYLVSIKFGKTNLLLQRATLL